jgi:hypothetical protein
MHFEQSIDIDAPVERVWEVLTDVEAWPQRVETVEEAELLTPGPMSEGSRVRLRQPKLPEGTWDTTIWEPPSYFEWRQKSSGVTTIAGHRVEPLGEGGGSRLTLSLDMKGLVVSITGRLFKDLTNRYMTLEAEGIKRAAETPES